MLVTGREDRPRQPSHGYTGSSVDPGLGVAGVVHGCRLDTPLAWELSVAEQTSHGMARRLD